MIRRPPLPQPPGSQDQDNVLRFDDAPEFGIGEHDDDLQSEDMDKQVRETQERLARLRMEQEEVERQKQMLESLKQKQERFIGGRKAVTEQLEQHLRGISQDLEMARRHVDDLTTTEMDFRERLEELRGFLPERWHRNQLDHELDRALASLVEAEAAFEKGLRRVSANRPGAAAPVPRGFFRLRHDEDEEMDDEHAHSAREDWAVWVRRGFAFTLPLIITLLLGLILAKLMF